MATVSIEKSILLNENAVNNMIEVLKENKENPNNYSLINTSEEISRGNEILKQLF